MTEYRTYFNPSQKAREEEKERADKALTEFLRKEKQLGRRAYPVYDTGMVSGSTPKSYSSFASLLPLSQHFNLKNYLQSELHFVHGDAVAVEIGGPGSQFMEDFDEDFLVSSIGVTLLDVRGERRKREDERRYHTVIPGDIQDPRVQDTLRRYIGPDGAHVIFENMIVGWESIPKNPYYIAGLLDNVGYQNLAEGGIGLFEYPEVMRPLIRPWAERVQQETEGSVTIRMTKGGGGVFEMRKHDEDAPPTLPLLTAREVQVLYKREYTILTRYEAAKAASPFRAEVERLNNEYETDFRVRLQALWEEADALRDAGDLRQSRAVRARHRALKDSDACVEAAERMMAAELLDRGYNQEKMKEIRAEFETSESDAGVLVVSANTSSQNAEFVETSEVHFIGHDGGDGNEYTNDGEDNSRDR